MTKEIKFRCWDGKEMFEPTSISWKNGIVWVCDEHGNNRFEYELVRPIEGIMQYTGLKDKNGKEIWEADIISWNDGTPSPVIWNGGCFEFQAFEKPAGPMLVRTAVETDLEIKGNIYENPELISK